MMKNIINMTFVAAATLIMNSCSDFLDSKSQDEVIPSTATDFGELLLGSGYPSENSNPYSGLRFMEDDFSFRTEDNLAVGSTEAQQTYYIYTWQPNMFRANEITALSATAYYQIYERIKGCNAVLDYIDEAVGTEAQRDRIKAEALAIRSYHYLMLVNIYGEPYNSNKLAPGVPLKLTSVLSESGIPRPTVEEVYKQIVNDLKESIQLFSKYNVTRGDFRINLPSAYILLSRVYLYMEQWDKCIEASTEAIRTGGVLTDMTVSGAVTLNIDYGMSEVNWVFGSSENGSTTSFGFSDEFVALFSPDDYRVKNTFLSPSYSWDGVFQYYILSKGISTQSLPGKSLRTSEAYLNRAEAYAHSNSSAQQALNDYNTLRRHRIAPYTDIALNQIPDLLQEIRNERRRELCFEGHRWFDLRRYGMPEIKHLYRTDLSSPVQTYTLRKGDPMYTLPIPESVLEKNRNLIQNASAQSPERQGTTN